MVILTNLWSNETICSTCQTLSVGKKIVTSRKLSDYEKNCQLATLLESFEEVDTSDNLVLTFVLTFVTKELIVEGEKLDLPIHNEATVLLRMN